jgi:L-iditol 2-dehydrogenase
MRVARLHGVGDVRLSDEPAPLAGPGESLVRVTAVGLCGSDLHWYGQGNIGDARLSRPLVVGHEFAGVTAAGQRVAVDPAVPCDRCDMCQAGHPNLCRNLHFAGHGQDDGGLRECLAWPERCLVPLPDTLSAAAGAMLEPLGVAIHAVDLGHVRAGASVGIFGCGPIGLLVLQAARAAGAADVLVTEPRPHRLDVARAFGAQVWTPGREVDVAFECAGEAGALDDAIAAARPGGRVVLVGIPDDDRTSFTASIARRKGLSLVLSRRMKHTYPRAIRQVLTGQVDVESLVTHRFPLEQAPAAFALAQRREGLKVIVEPS